MNMFDWTPKRSCQADRQTWSLACRGEVLSGDSNGQGEVGQCLGTLPFFFFPHPDLAVGGYREGSGNEGGVPRAPIQALLCVLLQVIPRFRSHFFVHGGGAGPNDLRSDILRCYEYPTKMQIHLEDDVAQQTINNTLCGSF